MRSFGSVFFLCLAGGSLFGQSPTAKPPQPVTRSQPDPLVEARRNPAKLVEKKFDDLTDKNLSEHGRAAIALADKWRHGETDHFVIHFLKLTDAQRLAREAEFYYLKIKLDLGADADRSRGKSHLYLFDKDKLWTQFRPRLGLQDWAAGVAVGRELFFAAEPGAVQANSNKMAHELTHVVFYRFASRRVPLWLNEGFAEFQSEAAYAKFKGVGHRAAGTTQPHQFPLADLTRLTDYPNNELAVRAFYEESERLVRFLISRHDNKLFVLFVNELSVGASFDEAVLKIYSAKYKAFPEFERAYQRF